MRILVIGVGAQGITIALLLTRSPEVSEVVLADIDMERVKRVADRLKSEKVSMRRVDASSVDDLMKVTKGADVVVNATLPNFNLKIMDAALRSGAHYEDFAGDYPLEESVLKKLALSDRWKKAGLTAVVNQGGPLTMNVLVRYAADQLDSVEEVRLRFAFPELLEEMIPKWSPSFAPEIALLEWTKKPIVYENGEYKRYPPFSGIEEYVFPGPLGPQTVCWVEYEPVITLPRFIGKGLKYVDCKITPDFLAGSLIKMGFASDETIDVKGVKVAPKDALLALTPTAAETAEELDRRFEADETFDLVECDLVEVNGEKAGEKIHYDLYRVTSIREMYNKFGTAMVDLVAIPGVVTAVMLAKGEIKTRGVIPPEGLEPEPFLARLAEMGWTYQERVTRKLRTA